MDALVFEHVPVKELPPAWREKLNREPDACVTVRIEAEVEAVQPGTTEDPLFGMWRDRDDIADVDAYVRRIRLPRF